MSKTHRDGLLAVDGRCDNPHLGKRGHFAYINLTERVASFLRTIRVDTPDKLNGILWKNSNCRLRDITDGASNTFMIGERCLDSGSGIWMGVTKNRNENDAISDCSHHAQLNKSITSFSSRHPDGAHFLMCDGRVVLISNKIESKPELGTYQKLGQRNDNQPVGNF